MSVQEKTALCSPMFWHTIPSASPPSPSAGKFSVPRGQSLFFSFWSHVHWILFHLPWIILFCFSLFLFMVFLSRVIQDNSTSLKLFLSFPSLSCFWIEDSVTFASFSHMGVFLCWHICKNFWSKCPYVTDIWYSSKKKAQMLFCLVLQICCSHYHLVPILAQ